MSSGTCFRVYFRLADEVGAEINGRETISLFEELENLPTTVVRSIGRTKAGSVLIGAPVDLATDGLGVTRALSRGMKEVSLLSAGKLI